MATKLNNQVIASMLHQIADKLEMDAENPYRVRAYRRAAASVGRLKEDIVDMVAHNIDLTKIPFVGEGVSAKIIAIVATGTVPEIKSKAKNKFAYNPLKEIAGLGAKRIKLLNELNIYNIDELKTAIETGLLTKQKGFSKNLADKILNSIANPKVYSKFFKLKFAQLVMTALIDRIKTLPNVKEVMCASAFRRKVEMVGNVDILVTLFKPTDVIKDFVDLSEVYEVRNLSANTVTVRLRSGFQITLHVVSDAEFAAALIIYTGSDAHLAQLKALAQKKQIQLDETGLFKKNVPIAVVSEEEIYRHLGLHYIEPELREARGEIEASKKNELPKLIQLADIKGDLHSHTHETDGTEPLEIMALAAKERGYEYYAITDHSKRLAITNGLDEKRLMQQLELIDELNSKLSGIVILKSIEVDILEDGSLDLPNWILKELDLRVCSLHSKFNLPEDKQTERIIRAMDNPYFNILGHATGRLLNHRAPYPINIEKILQAAKDRNCFMELNAQPSRLDLKDDYCLLAKQMGVKLAISSDAHSIRELDYMQFGIFQARRGWLSPDDVINTRRLKELKKLLQRH